MIEKFEEELSKEGLSDNSLSCYVRDIKLFIKYYEEKYFEKFTSLEHPDVTMYVNDLKKEGRSAATINRRLTALRRYNTFLVDKNVQSEIVVRDKDYIKIQENILSEDLPDPREITRIRHDIYKNSKNNKRDYCVFILLLYGGFRESEIVNLRVIDVHLNEHFINVIGKGNKFRQVMINNDMYDALEEYLQERNNMNIDSIYLFVGQKSRNNGGEKLNRNFCNRLLDKYKGYCKNTNLHPHLIRAYFCSNALHNAGYTMEQVANQAGHNSLNTTKRYLRSTKESLLALANKQ